MSAADDDKVRIGDRAKCKKGIEAKVTSIVVVGGRTKWIGETDDGKHWQSVDPTLVRRKPTEEDLIYEQLKILGG